MSAGGMDFPGLGVIPYDPPSEDLRPFMVKKLRKFAQAFASKENGVISREVVSESETLSSQYPEERRDEIKRELMTVWDYGVMVDIKSDSITEDQFVEGWLKRVYADPETKKAIIQRQKECVVIYFKYLDTKGEGRISFADYAKSTAVDLKAQRVIFDTFDTDKDGIVTEHDFIYGALMHHLVSGPESQYSYLYGPIED